MKKEEVPVLEFPLFRLPSPLIIIALFSFSSIQNKKNNPAFVVHNQLKIVPLSNQKQKQIEITKLKTNEKR